MNENESTDVQATSTDAAESESQEQSQTNENQNDQQQSDLRYSDDDLNRIINEKFAKWNKANEQEKAKQKAQDEEAKKLAKMNADQKTQYQIDKLKKELSEAQSANAKFEMSKQAQAMFEEADTTATSEDLEHVVTDNADTTQANVKWLIDHDAKVREQARQEFLKGTTPKEPGKSIKAVSQEEFARMSYAEKAQLQKDNPETFKKLTGGL